MHEEDGLGRPEQLGYRKTNSFRGGQETGRLAHGNPWLAKPV
jgi:hypothetical protein